MYAKRPPFSIKKQGHFIKKLKAFFQPFSYDFPIFEESVKSFLYLFILMVPLLPLHGSEILFLSTPRSGTHWCLYCLCTLLEKQVVVNRGPLEVDVFQDIFSHHSQGFIYAAHNPKDLWIKKNADQTDILITVVRNYRECLCRNFRTCSAILEEIRYQATFNWLDENKELALIQAYNHYFNNLRCFDQWNPQNRLLIIYEDLIQDPRTVLKQILTFFHMKDQEPRIDNFLRNIDFHIERCLQIYEKQGASESKGRDFLYHTKKLGRENSLFIDREVETLFPHLFHKYLKRYKLSGQGTE